MKPLLAALALLAPFVPVAADAATLAFTYAGADPDDGYVTAAGTGTISFDATGTLSLADITGFSFTQTMTLSDPSLMGAGTFSYDLADLTRFAGTFADGALSSLSLRTRTVANPTGFLADQSFQIRSLRSGGAGTAFDDAGSDEATRGTVRLAAAVPEPVTWGMMTFGIGAIGVVLRRRRRSGVRVSFAR